MKKSWLNGAVLGLLLFAQKELGKEPEKKEIQVNVPATTRVVLPQSRQHPVVQLRHSIYEPSTYSKDEINVKLDRIYNNIVGHPRWVENIKQVLQQMAQYDIGANLIGTFSDLDVKFVSAPANIMDAQGVYAYYDPAEKNIYLPNSLVDVSDTAEFLEKVGIIFEEMHHATQDAKGQLNTTTLYPSEDIATRQIAEMSAKLAVTVLESQMYQGMDDKKSSTCLFYESRLDQYEAMGLSPQDAERAARTDLTRVVWSCLSDTPEECEILPDEKEATIAWHKGYLRQAFVSRCLAMHQQRKRMTSMTSVFSILEAEKFANAEEKAEKERKENPFSIQTKRGLPDFMSVVVNNDLLPSIVADMDVSLSPDYFTNMQRTRNITGRNFVVTQYPDGTATRLSLKLYALKNKQKKVIGHSYIIIEEEFSKGALMRVNTYDMFGVVATRSTIDVLGRVTSKGRYDEGMYSSNTLFEYHGESKNKKSEITYYVVGGGNALYYDKNETLISRQEWDKNGNVKELFQKPKSPPPNGVEKTNQSSNSPSSVVVDKHKLGFIRQVSPRKIPEYQ